MKVEIGTTVCMQLVVDDKLKPGTENFNDAVDDAAQETCFLSPKLQAIDVMRPMGGKAIWAGDN